MDSSPRGLALCAPADPDIFEAWLERRRTLVSDLCHCLHRGFKAVAAFDGAGYLDCVQRQEALAERVAAHDAVMPELPPDAASKRNAASAIAAMNGELRRLGDIQTALIEIGGRSVRCFQRVWALASPAYERPSERKER
ncbi:MAG: hypothetical protein ACRD1Y_08600 [Terriglobales bacterium]